MDGSPLDIELRVTPDRLDAGGADTMELTAVLRNTGTEPVDTGIRTSDLLVDGTPAFSWRLAIGNGIGDPREDRLPPGDTVEIRRGMNATVLGPPGRHELVLRV